MMQTANPASLQKVFTSRWFLLLLLILVSACNQPGSEPATDGPTTPSPISTPTTPPLPIIDDLRVRQAIAYCTDRAALIRSVYPWIEETAAYEMDSFLPANHPLFAKTEPAIQQYPYDPGQGISMLELAGWTLAPAAIYRTNSLGEELFLALTTTASEFRQTWVPVFIEQMKACGLHLEAVFLAAEEFYASEGPLARRDFMLAAYASQATYAPDLLPLFACERIPSLENSWQGQNYSGWCSPEVDEAARIAGMSLSLEARTTAYRLIQEAYARDVPGLPLFRRMGVSATTAELQKFAPLPVEVYTWNAAEWSLPGRETIIVGERSEPAGLHPLDTSWVNQTIRALIDGSDYIRLGYDYRPITLEEFPTLENGGTVIEPVRVETGAEVVDAGGNAVLLTKGLRILTETGEEVVFSGDPIVMNQLTSTFVFHDNLTWSDGNPVTSEDYQLAYTILCDPQAAGDFFSVLPACSFIAEVVFVNDNTYSVTWKPGYHDPGYFLPPFSRLPAHQVTERGRLGDVDASDWLWLDEVNRTPIGIGPYILNGWEYGQEMVFSANPYYYGDSPAIPEIIIRFLPQPETGDFLLRGEIDVLDWTSLVWDDMSAFLLPAEEAGSIRLYFYPDMMFEQIDFDLSVK